MKLGKEEVKKVARLANITLTAKEIDKFSEQLSDVLTYIEKLNELDTTNVEPLSQVTNPSNVFKDDKVIKDRYIKKKTDKYFKTKAVLGPIKSL